MTKIATDHKAPVAKKVPYTHSAHQQDRNDPYHWMRLTDEQKESKQPDQQTLDVLEYLNAENAHTKEVMAPEKELESELYDEMVARIKKTDESVPYFRNEYWYYTRFEDKKEYPIYCRKHLTQENSEEVLLDVNILAEGHAYFDVGGLSISPDNKWLAYGVDKVSRRIYEIHFKNLETNATLDYVLKGTTGGATWANDNLTLFYTLKDEKTLRSDKTLKHILHTNPDRDALVYHEKEEAFYSGIYKTKSDKYLVVWSSSTLTNHYQILEADNPHGAFRDFSPKIEGHEYSIAHHEDKFLVLTNKDAVNFQLMVVPETNTEIDNWKELIGHREDVFLEGIEVFNDFLVVEERKNGLLELRIMNQRAGTEHYIDFAEEAYTAYSSVNVDFNSEILRFGYTSMTTPSSVYDYNMTTKEKTLLKQQEVVGGYTIANYATKRLYIESRDGVKIPVSIVYKKGIELDQSNPLLLYGYGSYGSTIDPYFSSVRLSLLDRGFVFAIAHVRGGQTMGRKWYEEGKMFKKKNTFFDFIDAAEGLIEAGYTQKSNLYAMGGSAGGLLMGAVINLRPDLFHGIVAAVPFVDVVSTMLDDSIPLTTGEYDEWGDPNNRDSYEYMCSYSPYDNVIAQPYPNMLVTTGYHDSQVQYWEPAKWVAKLRATKTSNNLLLLHTNLEAGHGGASGRFEQLKETALEYAFLLKLSGNTTLRNN